MKPKFCKKEEIDLGVNVGLVPSIQNQIYFQWNLRIFSSNGRDGMHFLVENNRIQTKRRKDLLATLKGAKKSETI